MSKMLGALWSSARLHVYIRNKQAQHPLDFLAARLGADW
jgi:hypothetical protein